MGLKLRLFSWPRLRRSRPADLMPRPSLQPDVDFLGQRRFSRISPRRQARKRCTMRYTDPAGGLEEQRMRTLTILFAVTLSSIGPATAADGCGPGCHSTVSGACAVDGWGTGARIWNECPVTTRARLPCPRGFIWKPRIRACGQTVKDWL
jgi:hypothetical protein